VKSRLHNIDLLPGVWDAYTVPPIHDSDRIQFAVFKEGRSPDAYKNLPVYTVADLFNQKKKRLADKLVIEIACGTGDFLTNLAAMDGSTSYMGIDYATPVIQRCAKKAQERSLDNILFYSGRVEDFLGHDFPEIKLSEIYINFPDPWPKKKHLKRRIVQADLLPHLHRALEHSGKLTIATDLKDLHAYHMDVLSDHKGFTLLADTNTAPHPVYEQYSNYQKKGIDQGRKIYFAVYQKI
jgi:tRNA (guanine-N7-)-methyltransferase